MKIYITNPKVHIGIRGRKSRVIVIEDLGGQRVDLVFTRSYDLVRFLDQIKRAGGYIQTCETGDTWPQDRYPTPESALQAHGLLESPLASPLSSILASTIDTPTPRPRKRRTSDAATKDKP